MSEVKQQQTLREIVEAIYRHDGHEISGRSYPDSDKQVIHCKCKMDFRYAGDHFKHAEEARISEATAILATLAAASPSVTSEPQVKCTCHIGPAICAIHNPLEPAAPLPSAVKRKS